MTRLAFVLAFLAGCSADDPPQWQPGCNQFQVSPSCHELLARDGGAADLLGAADASSDGAGTVVDGSVVDGIVTDSTVADLTRPCEGVVLPGGACFFSYCPSGYVWTVAEAGVACASVGAALCAASDVAAAFAAGYDSCCQGWTSTPCDGGCLSGYSLTQPSSGSCTSGTNSRCDPSTQLGGANCCRR